MRATCDTNQWVSSLLIPHGGPARLRRAFRDGRFVVVTSEPMLAELGEVLARPRLRDRYGISDTDIADLLRRAVGGDEANLLAQVRELVLR